MGPSDIRRAVMAENDTWDSEFDVVIAGAGGAGLAAAIEAAAAGARTVVFEKQGKIWESSTALNVGMVAFAGTDVQQRLGIEDSSELLYQDLLAGDRTRTTPAWCAPTPTNSWIPTAG